MDEKLMLLQRTKDFFQSLFSRGPIQTFELLKSTLADANSNEPFAKETAEVVNTYEEGSQLYVASKFQPLKELFSELEIKSTDVFVDIGAGKGRAMLIAFQAGFKKVKGIELSKELFKDAQTVLTLSEAQFELLNLNALEYEPTEEDNVFYLYDPFKDNVLEEVLRKIIENKITLIYHNNISSKKQVFEKFPKLRLIDTKVYSGNRFFIYST